VNEVRRYSDKTITIAARHVRRALPHVPASHLSKRERLDLLIERLSRQGLQPHDLARPSGADACVAIASMLRVPDVDGSFYRPYHAFLRKQAKVDLLVLDSLTGTFDYKSPPMRQIPKTVGRGFRNLDYRDLETRIAARIAAQTPPKLSAEWGRVIARVLRMPGALP
jgi:hypothetical protein